MLRDDLPANVSRIRLRMYHSDLITAVFHGRVFELFEEARTEVFRRLGFEYREIDDAGQAMIVSTIIARFLAPARFDELIQVHVFVDVLRKAQIRIAYEARRDVDGMLLFSGETSFAFVDKQRGRPVRVPAGIEAAVAKCPEMLRTRT